MRNKKCFVIHIFVAYLITYAHLLKTHKKKIIYLSKAEYAFVERNSERGYLIFGHYTNIRFFFFFDLSESILNWGVIDSPMLNGNRDRSRCQRLIQKRTSHSSSKGYISTQCALNTYNIVMLYLHILFLHNSLKSQAYCT